MACNAAFTVIANQLDCEKFLCQFRAEADQAWKDTNDIIFSHLLRYDSQLVAFISTAEGTFQAKRDEIWSHIHSLADAASIPHKACLTLALQILNKLPTIPLDFSYCTAIPMMLAHCPESYAFQPWSTTGDGDYLLDDNTQATNLLTQKLTHMAGGANLDDRSPNKAASGSAVLCSPGHSPSHSHSRTPANGKERSRSRSNSVSSLFSQESQPESDAASDSDDGSDEDSVSQDGSKSEEEGEVGSDGGASNSSGGSDDESSSSRGSGSEEATEDEGAQQDGSENEGKGSSSEMEGSDAGGSSSPSKSDDAESQSKVTPPVKKVPEVYLNTSQMLSPLNMDSKDSEEEWKTKWCMAAHHLDQDLGEW